MKSYLKSFVVLNVLILGLVLVNLIPNSFIYKNLCESATYYKENIDKIFDKGAEPGADMNQLNIMMNVDSKHPIYSALIDPIYGKTSSFMDADNGYNTIMYGYSANNDYSRYWHGYQIIYRPLLAILNASQIMKISWVIYVVLLILLVKNLRKSYDNYSITALLVMNIIYILPHGFASLTYIPLFYIMLLAVYLVGCTDIEPVYIFSIVGLLTAFFDFLTVETLAISVPFLFLIYRCYKEGNLGFINFVKCGLSWLFWYCFPYVYKWGITTLIYKENYFKKAFEEIGKYDSMFGRLMSVKVNINNLLFGVVSYNASIYIMIALAVIVLLVIYLFRKEGTEKCLISIFIVCLIPYIRYLVLAGHSYQHSYFEYRAQIVLIPAVVMLFYICFGKCKKIGDSNG